MTPVIPPPADLISAATRDNYVRAGIREANAWQRGQQTRDGLTRDSFQNFAARVGIGTANVSTASIYGFDPITRVRTLLEWMYRGSWIVGKAVDAVAEDMTKAGVSWLGSQTPENQDKLNNGIRRTLLWKRLQQGHKWSRLYGGALVVMMIDGQKLDTPLRPDTVDRGQLRGYVVLDRWMINPTFTDLVDDPASPDQGFPKYYDVVTYAPPALIGKRVHHSRCFRMIGVELPYWQMVYENYWGMSVLERLYDRLVAFDSSTNGAAQLMYRSYLRTLKVKDLRKVVAAGGPAFEGLVKQVETMRLFQVNEGITLVDGEDEFETHEYSFGGVADTILQMGQQLAGAIDTPLVRLFGQSPQGMDATGQSDIRLYYDGINQRQENDLRPQLEVALRVTARSEGVKLTDSFGFRFNPLWQLTDMQKSELAQRNTQTVLAVDESGVVPPKTILRELKQQSELSGMWTNITDEDIEAAADVVAPPAPAPGEGGEEGGQRGPNEPRTGPRLPRPRAGLGGAGEEFERADKTDDAVDFPGTINNQYQVQSGAVSNRGGGVTYVDASIPEWSALPSGWRCRNWKYLAIHEQAERDAMAGGDDYLHAHEKVATPVEMRAVRADGGDPREYTSHMNGLLSRIEHQRITNPPPDPHLRPQDAVHARRFSSRDSSSLPLREHAGLPIAVETRRGERRLGSGWAVIMPADYGYIRGTRGADGECVDCFLGPAADAEDCWVIDAVNPDTHLFDEHKVMLGFNTSHDALDHFRAAYSDGRGRVGGIRRMSADQLKEWLESGDTSRPVGELRVA